MLCPVKFALAGMSSSEFLPCAFHTGKLMVSLANDLLAAAAASSVFFVGTEEAERGKKKKELRVPTTSAVLRDFASQWVASCSFHRTRTIFGRGEGAVKE